MSDLEEPPSKICRMENEEHLEEGDDDLGEGQEEWLSEGVLTDDDYNVEMEQETLDSNLTDMGEQSPASQGDETPDLDELVEQHAAKLQNQDITEDWLDQTGTERDGEALNGSTLDVSDGIEALLDVTQNSNSIHITNSMVRNEIRDLEEALNRFDVKNDLAEELDAFLIRKADGKVIGKDMKNELRGLNLENDDGNDTDDLLRLLGDDDIKVKKKVLVKKSSKQLVKEPDSTDDEFSYENAASVKTLQVAPGAIITGRPAARTIRVTRSNAGDHTRSSDEVTTVRKVYEAPGKKPAASKSTAKPPARRGRPPGSQSKLTSKQSKAAVSQPKPLVSQLQPPSSQGKIVVDQGKIFVNQGTVLVRQRNPDTQRQLPFMPEKPIPNYPGSPFAMMLQSPLKKNTNQQQKPAWRPAAYKLEGMPSTVTADQRPKTPTPPKMILQSSSTLVPTMPTLNPDPISNSNVIINSDVVIMPENTFIQSELPTAIILEAATLEPALISQPTLTLAPALTSEVTVKLEPAIKLEPDILSELAMPSEPALPSETAVKSGPTSKSDAPAKSVASKSTEDEEMMEDGEFLDEEEEFDLDEEEFGEDSELEEEVQRQRVIRPMRSDQETHSDMESRSEDGSLYDEVPSSDSEDVDDWFTLDIRTERASDYLPFLGHRARELLLEEKKRVATRLSTLRQGLSALTESGRKQAEQLRQATMSLAELDDLLKAT